LGVREPGAGIMLQGMMLVKAGRRGGEEARRLGS